MNERTGHLLLDGALVPGRVRFEGGRLTAVEPLEAVAADAPWIVPGLVDLHVHGYGGFDPSEDLAGLAHALAAAGTTAFLPTLFPEAPARLGQRCAELWRRREALAGGARILGLHLEGPFVNPERAGGLPRDRLAEPSPAALAAVLGPDAHARGIRQMTLAPELPGAPELVAELVRSGVRVSLGHSHASASEAGRAAAHGARGVTHLYNAMAGLHHRAASLASFALAEDALVAEIIGDLVHVGREAFRLALRARGVAGLALVSDSLRGAASGLAQFDSHGARCTVRDGAIWIDGPGPAAPRLTGAEASLLEAVRRLVRAGVTDAATALTLAGASPARALGLERDLGVLAVGARADLLVLEPRSLEPREVLLGGEVVRAAPPPGMPAAGR